MDLARAGGDATLEALVQQVEITDDADAVLAEHAERLGMSVGELRQVPFLLVGTADEIVAAVRAHRERWGITRYAVRRQALGSARSAAAAAGRELARSLGEEFRLDLLAR